jgi:signal transduction histidine kinase
MKKILVMEDDDAIRSRIVDVLELEGDNFHVLAVNNGRKGVETALQELPDLIISDLMMPELDGYGALEALKSNPATSFIPFIILSAKADRDHIREGMIAGADDYLSKPFSLDDLLTAVHAQLAKNERQKKHADRKINDLRLKLANTLPHEFRTPLSGILGFAELLRDYELLERGDIMTAVDQICVNAFRLQRLVENFLMYAQVELSASDEEQRAAFRSNVTALAEDAITRTAERKADEYKRSGDVQVSLEAVTLAMTPQHVVKIVEELVDNAVKFSKPACVVSVTGNREGNRYKLAVQDAGRGMATEQIAEIGAYMQFERQTYEQQGSGLGLALVKGLVDLYDGGFSVLSTIGEGTMVTLMLPISKG